MRHGATQRTLQAHATQPSDRLNDQLDGELDLFACGETAQAETYAAAG